MEVKQLDSIRVKEPKGHELQNDAPSGACCIVGIVHHGEIKQKVEKQLRNVLPFLLP